VLDVDHSPYYTEEVADNQFYENL